jgi:hypothetical protein
MNEKIRALAGQSGFDVTHHKWIFCNDNVGEGECHELLERFAQLIVAECADLYNHEDVLAPIGMSARGEAHQHGWIEGTKTYRDTILEHFGVDK